jgi:predicted nucleic acid-binding Zn ribbon protein
LRAGQRGSVSAYGSLFMAKSKSKSGRRPVPAAPATKGRTPNGRPRGSAARRAALEKKRRRQRLVTIGVIAVVAVIAVVVAVGVTSGGSTSALRTAAPAPVVSKLESVPVSELVAAANAAAPGAVTPPTTLPSTVPALAKGNKPEILYVGAEYCPYCAAERWPMVLALSKFGTFQHLDATKSSSADTNPNTPTFSFHGSTFSSPYLAFTSVESQTRNNKPLETPTAAQANIVSTYDSPPYVAASSRGAIPFVFFGGKSFISGAEYNGAALSGRTVDDAASYLLGPPNPTSTAMKATAGRLIGVICSLTKNQPASVCSAVPPSLESGVTATAGG